MAVDRYLTLAIESDVIKHQGEVLNAEYGEPCVLKIAIAIDKSIAFTERWSLAGAIAEKVQPK